MFIIRNCNFIYFVYFRGSAGDEIVFHHTIPQEEIDKVYTEENSSNHYTKILNEEIKKCTDSLADLKIKEHVFE